MTRVRYRCPECGVICPGPEYVCRGSWWVYDPQRPGAVDPPHQPVLVVKDKQVSD